jgi:hypothetical protein
MLLVCTVPQAQVGAEKTRSPLSCFAMVSMLWFHPNK